MNVFDNGSSRGAIAGVATPSEIGSWQDDPRVVSALEEYLGLLKAGRRPSRQEFLDRHSDIALALGECLDGLEFVQSAVPRLPAAGPVGAEESLAPATRLGDYRIIREIGRGGMGLVYEADQISLGRRVALKVLPFASAIDPRQRQRFQVEAQAAAHLHHAHIVPVFAVGFDQGVHYYAMQFIEGRSLAAVIGELRMAQVPEPAEASRPARGPDSTVTLLPLSEPVQESKPHSASSSTPSFPSTSHRSRTFVRMVAQLGAQAAEALDHAHSLGVVHRDIKPSNLLVDPRGELWITDFGLARFQDDPGPTRTGDLVGTLRYMSPEQALGKRVVVDHRTDIYSLGATLYELLTLRPVFDGRDRQELLHQIAHLEPVAPRHVNPAIPRDLETILLKAMDKEAPRRYGSAQEMADDLRRFLDDKPIQARRPTALEHTAKWARRHRPVVVTTVLVTLLALIVSSLHAFYETRRTDAALKRIEENFRAGFTVADDVTMLSMQNASMRLSGSHGTAEDRRVYDLAQQFYDRIAAMAEPVPELIGVAAEAFGKAGFVRMVKNELDPAMQKYRRSEELFERAVAASPGDDRLLERQAQLFAFMIIQETSQTRTLEQRDPAAAAQHAAAVERLYRRQLVARQALAAKSPASVERQHDLAVTRLSFATFCEGSGRSGEADTARRQVREELQALAPHLPSVARGRLAQMFVQDGRGWASSGAASSAAPWYRLALVIDNTDPEALNDLAWLLSIRPGSTPYDPKEANVLAHRAVERSERNWSYWNTLGLTAYRAGDFPEAVKALETSMKLHGEGDASDWLILAMVRHTQGDHAEAHKLVEKSHEWLKAHPTQDRDVLALDREATALVERGGAADAQRAAGK
jgi:serine/threonine protein kinase